MRLLVSVTDAVEAATALDGGADVIDAKDPSSNALGAVSLETLRGIARTVGSLRLLTAALGDAADEASIEREAYAFAAAGAQLVKVGFAGISSQARLATLLSAAIRGARMANEQGGRRDGEQPVRHAGVVAVAYADAA